MMLLHVIQPTSTYQYNFLQTINCGFCELSLNEHIFKPKSINFYGHLDDSYEYLLQ